MWPGQMMSHLYSSKLGRTCHTKQTSCTCVPRPTYIYLIVCYLVLEATDCHSAVSRLHVLDVVIHFDSVAARVERHEVSLAVGQTLFAQLPANSKIY